MSDGRARRRRCRARRRRPPSRRRRPTAPARCRPRSGPGAGRVGRGADRRARQQLPLADATGELEVGRQLVVDGEVASRSASSENRTRRTTRSSSVTWSPAPMSSTTAQTATVSSAAASSRAPATTETATIAMPTHSRGSRHPGVVARTATGDACAPWTPRFLDTRTSCRPDPPRSRAHPQAAGEQRPDARMMRRWAHGRRSPLPHARRRGRGAQHVRRAGLRAGAPRRARGDQDRRSRPVAGRGEQARGVHRRALPDTQQFVADHPFAEADSAMEEESS